MKKLMLIILLTVSAIPAAAQQWVTVSSPLTKSALTDIFFINEQKGWACGPAGAVIHTNDGGANWALQNTGTDKDIAKIFFIDENTGWAGTGNNFIGGTGGSVLKTTDGGSTWTEIDFSSAVPNTAFTYCDGLVFVDAETGFMVTGKSKSNYILKTTDGGLTWSKKDSLVTTTAYRWYDIEFRNPNVGIVVGTKKDIQKYTTDGGETWTSSAAITDPFFKDLRAAAWLSDNEIVTLGEGNEFQAVPLPVYKSTDAGKTWVKKTPFPANSYDRVRGLYFKNGSEGIAIGSNGFSYPFLYKTADGGETWTPSNTGSGFSLRAVSGHGDVLYALGVGNHILKSTDFGTSWTLLNTKPQSGIYTMGFRNGKGMAVNRTGDFFKADNEAGTAWNQISSAGLWETYSSAMLDENTIYLLKENRYIVKSTDGGVTWQGSLPAVNFNSRNKSGGIAFADFNTGYAWMSINDYGEYHVYKTADAGASWNEVLNTAGPGSLSGDILVFDPNTAVLAGPNLWFNRTADGGASWNLAAVNNTPAGLETADIKAVAKIDENTAWAVGFGVIYKTTDKGASWNYVPFNNVLQDSTLNTVAFQNESTGYIGTFSGEILKTTDGGASWTLDNTFYDKTLLVSSGFNSLGEVFFGTTDGDIIKWDSGISSAETAAHTISYGLSQNYPNPFNPSTVISFNIEKAGNVKIEVYDLLGRKMASAAEGFYNSGTHSVTFDASGLTSGIYFYRITAGSYSAVKKMTLLR